MAATYLFRLWRLRQNTGDFGFGIDGHFDTGGKWHFMWREYEFAAKAVIRAMREPTEAMGEALDRVPGGFGRGAWYEGIDAALPSPPSSR